MTVCVDLSPDAHSLYRLITDLTGPTGIIRATRQSLPEKADLTDSTFRLLWDELVECGLTARDEKGDLRRLGPACWCSAGGGVDRGDTCVRTSGRAFLKSSLIQEHAYKQNQGVLRTPSAAPTGKESKGAEEGSENPPRPERLPISPGAAYVKRRTGKSGKRGIDLETGRGLAYHLASKIFEKNRFGSGRNPGPHPVNFVACGRQIQGWLNDGMEPKTVLVMIDTFADSPEMFSDEVDPWVMFLRQKRKLFSIAERRQTETTRHIEIEVGIEPFWRKAARLKAQGA